MIVVIMHEDHYVAVPCFTYQGKGIGAKNADDHVSIHDCRSKGPVPRQTKHSTLEVGYMYDGTDIFDERSVAHFAYPICRPYSELYRQTIPPSPSTKAANDAQKAKLVKERDRVLLATQAAAELTAALARKEKTTPVVAQLVQPLRDTLKAKEEQVEALVTLLSGLNM
ncbi:hypothetical protein MMC11_005574 [Xylographa trunciseda]|nr:hypothetical protein [Xylographa trunciseda]